MALFVVVPLLELAILVWLGEHVGILPTVGLVIFTGVLGAWLARWQGVATWGRFREAVAAGRMPHRELVEGLLVLVAGAVLLTPGLITDVTGFTLLVPPVRRRVAGWIGSWLEDRVRLVDVAGRPVRPAGRTAESGGTGSGDAVEVEYQVVDSEEVEEERREP
jgi:UPF0716 protein FxsA